jgi:hypothetical protein
MRNASVEQALLTPRNAEHRALYIRFYGKSIILCDFFLPDVINIHD